MSKEKNKGFSWVSPSLVIVSFRIYEMHYKYFSEYAFLMRILGLKVDGNITSTKGRLGLGVSANLMKGDYNLWVSKGIMTERIKVAVSGALDWSDIVFDKSYELKSLDQVEKFIKTNHHLPDVPSANQLVEEKGYDVQKMDATLLQKIEELTLYLLEIKKENKELQKLISKK